MIALPIVTFPVAHFGLATSRKFRRAFIHDFAKAARDIPENVVLELFIQCQEGGACCRAQSLKATKGWLGEALEEWAPGLAVGHWDLVGAKR